MKLPAKLSALIVFAYLVPFALQAQAKGKKKAPSTLAEALRRNVPEELPIVADSVNLKTGGGESKDTAFHISYDSATAVLKATQSKVVFIDGVRSSKKDLSKVAAKKLAAIDLTYGNLLIRQYGEDAKAGVISVKTRSYAIAYAAAKSAAQIVADSAAQADNSQKWQGFMNQSGKMMNSRMH